MAVQTVPGSLRDYDAADRDYDLVAPGVYIGRDSVHFQPAARPVRAQPVRPAPVSVAGPPRSLAGRLLSFLASL